MLGISKEEYLKILHRNDKKEIVDIKDATYNQLRQHYREANIKEFQDIRSTWLMQYPPFAGKGPLMDEYRDWLLSKGNTKIAITCKGE